MKKDIYLDNASTTLRKPPEVKQAIIDAFDEVGNVSRGVTNQSLYTARAAYNTRELLAALIHASSGERVAFTKNSTESLNIAIQGTLKPGDHVITTQLEHNSVLRPLYEMEKRGVELSIIGCDEKGNVDYEELKETIKENTVAIVITHASNLTGNIVDLELVGKIARERQVMLIVDSSQSAGVLSIDVEKMHIDILCFTGHKGLLGPQGIGGIYVREGAEISPLIVGGSGVKTYSKQHPIKMPESLEAGTLNGLGIIGLGAGVRFIRKIGIEKIYEVEHKLMDLFYREVRQIEKVKVYGDFEQKCRCPIVSINIGDYDSAVVSDELMERFHIATRSGGHCAPLMHEFFETKQQGMVRFSFSYFNTQEEVELAIEAVKILASEV